MRRHRAVVLGLCTVFGTLIPSRFAGDFAEKLLGTVAGWFTLLGLAITVAGIIVVAIAGARKDTLVPAAQAAVIVEFNFSRGIWVAIFSGIMSSCYAFGLAAGEPIRHLSAAAGTGALWVGLPVICLITFGGLLTNTAWCGYLIVRNNSAGQWLGRQPSDQRSVAQETGVPLPRNYLLSALGGTLWYFQFFFYTMGESQMGRFGFSSWTLHMASIIIFGTI